MITETTQAIDKNGNVVNRVLRPNTSGTIKVATGAVSAVIDATNSKVVRITVDADSHYDVGPTAALAAVTDAFISDGQIEIIRVAAGDKISVLGGNLYITPLE